MSDQDTIKSLREALERAESTLWRQDPSGNFWVCGACFAPRGSAHKPNCWASVLRETAAPQKDTERRYSREEVEAAFLRYLRDESGHHKSPSYLDQFWRSLDEGGE